MESTKITVIDTTLRDGEQSPGCSMNVQEKVRLGRQLDLLGVDVIEAGFPIASDGDFAAVRALAAAVPRPVIAALARAARHDIERAAQKRGLTKEALFDQINLHWEKDASLFQFGDVFFFAGVVA